MLLGNLTANLVAVLVTSYLDQWLNLPSRPDLLWLERMGYYYDVFAFCFGAAVMLWWEQPIRRHLRNLEQGRTSDPSQLLRARQRLLNEPFVAIAADLFLWCAAAVIFGWLVASEPATQHLWRLEVLRSLIIGLITVTAAFFVLERILQYRLAPLLFPQGGLTATPGTMRIKIGTRIAALVMAASLAPFAAIIFTIRGSMSTMEQGAFSAGQVLDTLQTAVVVLCLLFIANAAVLAFLVTVNLTRSLKDMVSVLHEVKEGNFRRKVQVTSNDEIGYTGDTVNLMTTGLAERDFIKETFGKYVSRQVRDEILAGRIPLDGEIKMVTVLFADLRNFTPLVEATPPKEVVQIINGYFQQMSEAIRRHGGLVLQFIGDEIEAVFGAPLPLEDHPRKALEAALAMRARLVEVNAQLSQRGLAPLRHGIGIHTGDVVAANIGSPERLSYALVGDTVNLASRLQGLNKRFDTDILISGTTAAALDGDFALTKLPVSEVKGKTQPVEVFAVS